jgi:lysophospholipid acyltransferase
MGIPTLQSYEVIYNQELAHLPDIFPVSSFKHLIASTSLAMKFPSDQVRFLICLLSFIILGHFFKYVPGKLFKNIYCLFLGFAGTWIIMGPPSLNMLISSMTTYLIVEVCMPRSPVWKQPGEQGYNEEEVTAQKKALYEKRQMIGRGVFFFSMVYICASHVYRYVSDYLGYRLDFTAAQMLLTIKISAYAWNRVDGETLNDGLKLDDIPRDEEFRMERAIRDRPSVLQYLAWVYHFTSCLAGPSIDYREYEMYLDGSLWKQYGLEECPSTITATLTKFFYCLASYPGLFILSKFPLGKYVGSEQYYIDNPTVWSQVGYIMLFNGFSRYKYYFAWYLAEAASVSTGIGISGYNKETKEIEWDRCNGSRGWLVESSTSVQDLISSWNIRCSEWLKHYVFLRTKLPNFLKGKISERSFADLSTKFTSAFWHGVYPGYYTFFLQVFFLSTFQDQLNKYISWMFYKENPANPRKPILQFPTGWIYLIIMNIFTLYSFHWLGASFVLLEFGPTWSVLYNTYFWYHIGGFLVFILPGIIFKKKRVPREDQNTDKTKVAAVTVDTKPVKQD